MIATITVTGQFLDRGSRACSGELSFTPSSAGRSSADDVLLSEAPTRVTLDASGAFRVDLYATDDTAWIVPGWTYAVREAIDGASERTYSIELLTASGASQKLTALAPVEQP